MEFVKKYLNSFNDEQLKQLEKFLEFEDEIIYNFYNFDKVKKDIDKNKINKTSISPNNMGSSPG